MADVLTTERETATPLVASEDTPTEADETTLDEVEIDYSYMERACARAANAPGMVMTEADRAAYAGLSSFSYMLDSEREAEEA